MRDIAKLAEKVEELRSEILGLTELSDEEITTEQAERLDPALAEFAAAQADYAAAEARATAVAAVRDAVVNKPEVRTERSTPALIVKKTGFEVLENRGAGMSHAEYRQELTDGNLRAIENKVEGTDAQAHVERLLKRHADDTRWAESLLRKSHPDYESAFSKVITGREHSLSNEERTALSSLTNANGKYAVPTHLDPSIILTNTGTSNAIRGLSRVVTLTEGTQWNGLSSAGVTASFDTELSEVSDDSPTFAQPTVALYQARAFVQASIQAEQDIAGLAGELLMLFADAKDRAEGAAHATGSGPIGVFTAVDLTSGSELTTATAATLALADLNSVYTGLPVRYRAKATWVYNPQVGAAIKALGTAVSASFSGDLRDPYAGRINGRPVVESDDAPFVSTTTALDNRLIFGDFSNFVIVDKPGSMAVEYIPHMFATNANLPMGARGWFAHWRTGSDSVNDDAFRLLQDKTSA